MSRTPTTTDTTVEWEEKVTDPDSEQLTITLVLDAVDDGTGFTNDGTNSSNLSWLSFSKDKSTLADGTTEVLVNIVADKSGLDQGYSYRFKITADDGTTSVDRTFTLTIDKPLYYEFGSYTKLVGNNPGTRSTIFVKPDGSKIYAQTSDSYGVISEYPMNTAFDPSDIGSKNGDSGNLEAYFLEGFGMSSDGKNLITTDTNGNGLAHGSTLSTAWDIQSYSYDGDSIDVSGSDNFPQDASFAGSGDYFYVADESTVYGYSTSNPGSLASADITQEGSFSPGSEIQCISVSYDGREMVVAGYQFTGGTPYTVHYYKLTTPFNITTATKKAESQFGYNNTATHFHLQLLDQQYMFNINSEEGLVRFTLE